MHLYLDALMVHRITINPREDPREVPREDVQRSKNQNPTNILFFSICFDELFMKF